MPHSTARAPQARAAGVASRRVARRRRLRAELGRLGGRRGGVPGGRRQRPVLGTFEPVVGSHLAAAYVVSPPLWSFGEAFQEDCDSAAGPEAELSDTGDAGGDSPGDAEA